METNKTTYNIELSVTGNHIRHHAANKYNQFSGLRRFKITDRKRSSFFVPPITNTDITGVCGYLNTAIITDQYRRIKVSLLIACTRQHIMGDERISDSIT